jgi:hypothetical protein
MFMGLSQQLSDPSQDVDVASVGIIEARSIYEDDILPIYDSRNAGCLAGAS